VDLGLLESKVRQQVSKGEIAQQVSRIVGIGQKRIYR
jgi:hypothetical protein